MSESEAKEAVKFIRGHVTEARDRIIEFYERSGWKSLGYDSWKACIEEEFKGIGKSTIYKQLASTPKKQKRIGRKKGRTQTTQTATVQNGTVETQASTVESNGHVETAETAVSAVADAAPPIIRNPGNTRSREPGQDDEDEPAKANGREVGAVPLGRKLTEIKDTFGKLNKLIHAYAEANPKKHNVAFRQAHNALVVTAWNAWEGYLKAVQ